MCVLRRVQTCLQIRARMTCFDLFWGPDSSSDGVWGRYERGGVMVQAGGGLGVVVGVVVEVEVTERDG